jgi:tryptophan-rich sensory protein
VWRGAPGPARTRALALWGTQLALNAGWSAVFFGARRPRAALVEIGALLASIAGYAAAARKVDRPAAWLVAPYAAWTAFAAVLNAGIVRRNPQLA